MVSGAAVSEGNGGVPGLGPPGLLATLLPLLLASFTRALSDAAEFEEDPKELEVIQAALQNCDRYYNVMVMSSPWPVPFYSLPLRALSEIPLTLSEP